MSLLSSTRRGGLIREEIEIPVGSTLVFTEDFPIGATGWQFSSNFQHENGATIGAGSFTISILTETLLGLRSGSDGLPLGRYVFDIRAENVATGEIKITAPRDFRLVDSVTLPQSSEQPTPPSNILADIIGAAISEHNLSVLAHPNGISGGGPGGAVLSYRTELDPEQLIGSYLILEHNLNQTFVDVTVFDDDGVVAVEYSPISANTVQLNFDGLLPIMKTYTILVEK